jgi:hypothetical protein
MLLIPSRTLFEDLVLRLRNPCLDSYTKKFPEESVLAAYACSERQQWYTIRFTYSFTPMWLVEGTFDEVMGRARTIPRSDRVRRSFSCIVGNTFQL